MPPRRKPNKETENVIDLVSSPPLQQSRRRTSSHVNGDGAPPSEPRCGKGDVIGLVSSSPRPSLGYIDKTQESGGELLFQHSESLGEQSSIRQGSKLCSAASRRAQKDRNEHHDGQTALSSQKLKSNTRQHRGSKALQDNESTMAKTLARESDRPSKNLKDTKTLSEEKPVKKRGRPPKCKDTNTVSGKSTQKRNLEVQSVTSIAAANDKEESQRIPENGDADNVSFAVPKNKIKRKAVPSTVKINASNKAAESPTRGLDKLNKRLVPSAKQHALSDTDDIDDLVLSDVSSTISEPGSLESHPEVSKSAGLPRIPQSKSRTKSKNRVKVPSRTFCESAQSTLSSQIFLLISQVVRDQSNSKDRDLASNPTWLERILMYEPIDLVAFTEWLNQQTQILDELEKIDKESQFDLPVLTNTSESGERQIIFSINLIHQWCRENSVCALNFSGNAQKIRTKKRRRRRSR